MNTKFTVKNFRSFDKDGATFDIAPITLLTGCNSSGKSSLVKSMTLLSKFIQQMKDNYQKNEECWPNKYPLGATDVKLQLGNYASILNRNADSNGKITLAYSIKPLQSDKEFIVSYVFQASETDNFNEGWLKEITIETTEGDLIFHVVVVENKAVVKEYNLFPLKNGFIDFSLYEVLAGLRGYFYNYEMLGEESGIKDSQVDSLKEDIKSLSKALKTRLTEVERRNFKLWDLRNRHSHHSKYEISGNDQWFLKPVESFDSLFPLPIFKKLQGVTKEKTSEVVWKYYKCDDEEIKENIRIILEDFDKSEYDTFLEYFTAKENTDGLSRKGTFKEFFFHPKNIFEAIISYIEGFKVYPWFNVEKDIWHSEPVREIRFEGDEVYEDVVVDKGKIDSVEDKKRKYEEKLNSNRETLPFGFVYDNLLRYSVLIDKGFAKHFHKDDSFADFNGYPHPCLKFFKDYIYEILVSIMLPQEDLGNFKYVSSSRVAVQRLYTFDNHDDFGKLLSAYYKAKQSYVGDYKAETFLNRWIQKFGIGHHISIKNTEEGLGIVIRLHENEKDDKGRLLADEGYGISQLLSVLLEIETNILSTNSLATFKTDDGYYIYDPFRDRDNTIQAPAMLTIAIEEPEIHLHPAFQSLLADMMVEAYKSYNIHFIVETHSEYLIRKLQVLVAGKYDKSNLQVSKEDASIFYVNLPEKVEKTNVPQVKRIEICEDGYLDGTFGTGFFDEATRLSQILL